ncbi:MAG: hypothetical protein MKZ54_03095, partial [Candidatus Poseidoniaceae archaeon]|nr:hypothetical protein [Candidatus Poseidoniaceae archaeon]
MREDICRWSLKAMQQLLFRKGKLSLNSATIMPLVRQAVRASKCFDGYVRREIENVLSHESSSSQELDCRVDT